MILDVPSVCGFEGISISSKMIQWNVADDRKLGYL